MYERMETENFDGSDARAKDWRPLTGFPIPVQTEYPAHDKTKSGRLNRVLTARLGCMNEWKPKILTGLTRELKTGDP